ncbi:MAG: hypothetical protein AAFX99_36370 [Myxococcota bacterium]
MVRDLQSAPWTIIGTPTGLKGDWTHHHGHACTTAEHTVDHEGQVLDLAVDRRLVEKTGSWYSHQGHRLGQGRVNTTAALRQDPKRCSALLKAIYDPNLT